MKKFLIYFFISIFVFLSCFVLAFAETSVNFSDEEITFIENNPIIYLGVDPKFVPFEFIDTDDAYKGIAKDFLDLVSGISGLKFEIHENLSWPEAYEKAVKGELDGLPAIGKTDERENLFIYSEPYYNFHRVLAISDDDNSISNIQDLEDYPIAVQRNSSHHSYLLENSNLNLNLYDSVEAALYQVAIGNEKVFLGNLATSSYIARSQGISGLRFISFEAEKPQSLYFVTHKNGSKELISIFNKSIMLITEKQKSEIRSRWVYLDTKVDYSHIIKVVIITLVIILITMLVSMYWISRLKAEIKEKTLIQSALEEANVELKKMSMIDGLTGISNRRYFDEFVVKLWGINVREKFSLNVMMLDIDDFKKYNDTYGHLAGDECLQKVANVINDNAKRSGDIAARFGGEEFIVWLSNTELDGAIILAERIRAEVEALTPVTISIGVSNATSATTNITNLSPYNLIKTADDALYQAKDSGKNQVVVKIIK